MTEPVWIEADDAILTNLQLIEAFGGLAAGSREGNLLLAAIARPLNKWHYAETRPSLFELAAAYAFGIARGHVFHDGNKRTAYTTAIAFSRKNGVDVAPPGDEIVETTVALAEGALDEDAYAAWLRGHVR
jgi:death-on-curing protein